MTRTEDGFSLDVIGVAKPCPADWDAMAPQGDDPDRVRHCDLCKLNVYNLSGMTRDEATRLVQDQEGRLCVRFYRRADGTVLTADCPVGLRKAARWARRRLIGAMVLLLMFLMAPVVMAMARGGDDGMSFTQRVSSFPLVQRVMTLLNPAPNPAPLMGDVCIPAPTPPVPPAPPQPQPDASGEVISG